MHLGPTEIMIPSTSRANAYPRIMPDLDPSDCIPSVVGLPGMPEPAARPKGPKLRFTTADDELLVYLKEEKHLVWKQISEFFPGRSSGTLQVRYCTKLKSKGPIWTADMMESLRLAISDYGTGRWHVIAAKVGNGFSAAQCEGKARELHGDGGAGQGQHLPLGDTSSACSGERASTSRSEKRPSSSPPDGSRDDESKRQKDTTASIRETNHKCFRCPFKEASGNGELCSHRDASISQIVRHMRKHKFWICAKCFTTFRNLDEQETHDRHKACVRSLCGNRRCKRYKHATTFDGGVCICITSSAQQWQEILEARSRLQLPATTSFKTELDILGPIVDTTTETGDFSLESHGIAWSDTCQPASQIYPPSATNKLADLAYSSQEPLSSLDSKISSMQHEITVLQEAVARLHALQADAAKSSQADLEMVLRMVWSALERSGSDEALPRSPLWCLVNRFASSVLERQTEPAASFDFTNPTMPASNFDAWI